MAEQVRECVDCHENFVIEAGEVKFFESKGMSLPKRCKPCRAIKKQRNQAREQRYDD